MGPIASLVMGKKSRHAKTLIHRKITAFYACALNKIQQNSKWMPYEHVKISKCLRRAAVKFNLWLLALRGIFSWEMWPIFFKVSPVDRRTLQYLFWKKKPHMK